MNLDEAAVEGPLDRQPLLGAVRAAMPGSGVLARSHATMLRPAGPVREIRLWIREPRKVTACPDDIGGTACTSAEEAVRGAWLKAGAFVAAVGG